MQYLDDLYTIVWALRWVITFVVVLTIIGLTLDARGEVSA